MSGERYFLERRTGRQQYQLVGTQPAAGFESVHAAIEWLAARGWITRRLEDGEPYWHGWGGDSGFYARAVQVRRRAEPEAELVLIGSLAEYSTRFGAGPLRLPPVLAEPSFWRRALRAALEEFNRRMGRL